MEKKQHYDVDENHDFWKRCSPDGYLKVGPARGQALIDLFRELGVDGEDSIMELGCNCGRNLAQLWDAGYRRVTGIELNPKAVKYFYANFGNTREFSVHEGSIEYHTKPLAAYGSKYDVIFTMAVLFHMHPDSEWCFADIAKMVGKYLVLIEREGSHKPPRHYARCYKTIFERHGLVELWNRHGFADIGDDYVVRVFSRVV